MRSPWRPAPAVLLALIVLAAATRLFGIDRLPRFLDEGWYISWSWQIASGESPFRPWLSGKGISILANALVLPWAGGHDLVASRVLTVAFSLVTLVGLWALTRRLYDQRTAALAGLLYVLCPFTLFHDRLFLADPVMSTFLALLMVASVDLARRPRVREAVLAGLALTLVVLSKANGVLLAFVPAAAWLAFARPLARAPRALATAYGLAVVLLALPLARFLETTSAVRFAIGNSAVPPLERVAPNLALLGEWLRVWATPPLCALALGAAVVSLARRQAAGLFLAAIAFVPLALLVPTATVWYSRYVLFVALPGLVLAARALAGLADFGATRLGLGTDGRGWLLAAATALALGPSLVQDAALWTDPRRAEMPADDRFQYVDGWPSGYGVRDTVAWAARERARLPGGMTVVVRSHAPLTTVMALRAAFRHDPAVRVEDLPLDQPVRARPLLEAWARERPTLLVVSRIDDGRAPSSPESWAGLGASLVAETHKPNGAPCDAIYRLDPPPPGVATAVP